MIIKHAHIDKFRAIENLDFDLGQKITAVVGHNGTMKTTILGILSQTFTITKDHPMVGEKTIDGYNFHSQFSEKFKMTKKDVAGEHQWHLDFYDGIYKNNSFEAKSIWRDKAKGIIRFWSTEGRGADMNYPQIPVYYISLKRVTPIGEEKEVEVISELSEEENRFLAIEYREIISDSSKDILSVESISSKNKHSAAIHTDQYDALTISAGQDNIAKLLLAVLSFKRLKDKFQNDYKGGIILIDEIESTLHPSAQQRLIKRMYKYASDYKIQFIFTTHSPSVIKSAFFDKYNKRDAQLLYLKKVENKVIGYNNPDIQNVVAELSGEVLQKRKKLKKLNIFCEDVVARHILRNFLSSYMNTIKIQPCSLGAEEYLELLRVKLHSISESVVILDGDKNITSTNNKIAKYNAQNVIFLPSNCCPERMLYKFLHDLSASDPFWDNTPGGFDKYKCFLNYVDLTTNDSNKYKDWFNDNKSNFGRSYKKLLDYWKLKQTAEYNAFINDFKAAFNNVAEQFNYEKIDD